MQSLTNSNSDGLISVACASTTRCEAVNNGQLVTIANGVPNPPQLIDFPVTDVACANATNCEAIGSTTSYSNTTDPSGQVGVVPITNGVAGTPIVVPGYLTISGLACSSTSTCQAVGSYYHGITGRLTGPGERGVVLPIVDGVPGEAQLTPGVKELLGVACPSASSCRAVGYQDRASPNHSPSRPRLPTAHPMPWSPSPAPARPALAHPAPSSCSPSPVRASPPARRWATARTPMGLPSG